MKSQFLFTVLETDDGRGIRRGDGEAMFLRSADHLRPHQRVVAALTVAIGQLSQTGVGAAKRRWIFDRLRRFLFQNEEFVRDRKRLFCTSRRFRSRLRVGQLPAETSSPRELRPSAGMELLLVAEKNELVGSAG